MLRLGLVGHLHTFRHAFISHAAIRGIPEAIIRKWVGHVDADVLKIYTHIADEASQAAMQRLTGLDTTNLQTKGPKDGQTDTDAGSARFQHTERIRKNEGDANN